mgnify:CR=1 FL=1
MMVSVVLTGCGFNVEKEEAAGTSAGKVGLIVSACYSSHNWCLNFIYLSTISSFLGIVFLMLDKQK